MSNSRGLKSAWTSTWAKLFPDKSKDENNANDRKVPDNTKVSDSTLKAFDDNKRKSNQIRNLHSGLCGDTMISKETEINGSITSRTNISVDGAVKGNIKSEANVKITGSVEGDIIGKSIEIYEGNIIGNITSKTSVIVSDKSVIKGDVICNKFDMNGNMNGNAQVNTTATLGKDAVIHGNLTSQNLSIQEGAIVNGTIKVSRDKEDSIESRYQVNQPAVI